MTLYIPLRYTAKTRKIKEASICYVEFSFVFLKIFIRPQMLWSIFLLMFSVLNIITKLEVDMEKKSNLNISKTMADKIPYQRCYEEHGIIETEHGIFSCAYEICSPTEQMQVQYNVQLVRNCMDMLLSI